MLQEDELNRPRSFSVLLQHPFLADENSADRLPLRFPSYRGLSLPAGQRYHFFLSHNQREAGDIAHTLFETMKSLGLEVWYDMDAADLTVEGMVAGVRESMYFLLIVTTSVFQRPFCRREIDEALQSKKEIVHTLDSGYIVPPSFPLSLSLFLYLFVCAGWGVCVWGYCLTIYCPSRCTSKK